MGGASGESGAETEGVDVGVLQLEQQADGTVGEFGQVPLGVPGNDAVELVAVLEVALIQGEPGYGFTVLLLQFDPEPASGGGGEIDLQAIPAEQERSGSDGAAGEGGVDRGEAVQAERMASQPVGSAGAGVVASWRKLPACESLAEGKLEARPTAPAREMP
jgi:hypothetical protein